MSEPDLSQIRQLLERKIVATRNSASKTDDYLIPLDSRYIVSMSIRELEQILTLLPCETCNDTGIEHCFPKGGNTIVLKGFDLPCSKGCKKSVDK